MERTEQIESKVNFNQEKPNVWSKMRKYFGIMVWVSIGYIAYNLSLKAFIWVKIFSLIESDKLDSAMATIISNSNKGIDSIVLGVLLGIPFGGKVWQKFAEK